MSRTIRVDGVPEDVHHTLTVRAALREQTLSDYVRDVLERCASRPSPHELLARLDRDAPEALGASSVAEVRRARDRAT